MMVDAIGTKTSNERVSKTPGEAIALRLMTLMLA